MVSPAQTCNLRLQTSRFVYSFGFGVNMNRAMGRPAGRSQGTSFCAGEPRFTAESTPLGQVPQGEVFSGFLPGPSIHGVMIMALGKGGSCQQEALPSLTHQVFFPATTSAWQGVPQWCWDGQRGAALSPLWSRCQQMGYRGAPPFTNKKDFYRLINPQGMSQTVSYPGFPARV